MLGKKFAVEFENLEYLILFEFLFEMLDLSDRVHICKSFTLAVIT